MDSKTYPYQVILPRMTLGKLFECICFLKEFVGPEATNEDNSCLWYCNYQSNVIYFKNESDRAYFLVACL